MNQKYSNIIGHIVGIDEFDKENLEKILIKNKIFKNTILLDLDILNNKIIKKYNLIDQINIKKIDKKIFEFWKFEMKKIIDNIIENVDKKILFIGYLNFMNNNKILINLPINTKFIVKDIDDDNIKKVIRYNISKNYNEIINGKYDLNNINFNVIKKKKEIINNIYKKNGYYDFNLIDCINTINLNNIDNKPDFFYYASFNKYENKIPIINQYIFLYKNEWLSVSNIFENQKINKGINNNNFYINISPELYKKLNNYGFIYIIENNNTILAYPTKTSIYKYITNKSQIIFKIIYMDNIINIFKKMNILINIVK